jgi:hypothetical protein
VEANMQANIKSETIRVSKTTCALLKIVYVSFLVAAFFGVLLISLAIIDFFSLTISYMASVTVIAVAVWTLSFTGLCISMNENKENEKN